MHPGITSVSPNPFSPNHDGNDDKTSFRIHLFGTADVSLRINNMNGKLVWGPHTPGKLTSGDHTYQWDGKNNASKIARDGTYSIVVTTSAKSGNVTLHGTATATVRVDNSASTLSGITGNGNTFYPVVDGYKDTFRPKVHVNEGGSLWLEVFTMSGTKVKFISHRHAVRAHSNSLGMVTTGQAEWRPRVPTCITSRRRMQPESS